MFSFIFFLVYEKVSFYLLVILVSLFILYYIKFYMFGEFNFQYYSSLIIIFILSIVVLLLANSYILLLLSWEVLGVRSFFLINYYQS